MVPESSTTPQPATIQRLAFSRQPDLRTPEQREADRQQWDEVAREYAIEAERQRRAQRWLRVAKQIGHDYASRRLSNWEFHGDPAEQQAQRDTLGKFRTFRDGMRVNATQGHNLIIFGAMGTGKDYLLSVAMRHAVLSHGFDVLWQNGTEMFSEFRATMRSDSEQCEARLLRALIGADILAISDPLPPSGVLSEYQAATLFSIVDGRYRAQRPTWLTLNVVNGNEARSRMGAQTVDRLTHRAVSLFCNWNSYRQFDRTGGA